MTTAVDLFAGVGGSSTGLTQAGYRVLLAADHWPAAVEWHTRNHPQAEHWLQDLHQADFRRLPKHWLLSASPSCVGHTRARGAERPGHDAARSTAWAVVSAAEAARPSAVVVENVPEFLSWELYPAWHAAMSTLGYEMQPHVVDAADLGVPQHRRRLYLVARKWQRVRLSLAKCPHRGVGSVIRWDAGEWRPWSLRGRAALRLHPLSPATVSRIEAGRDRWGERFTISYYGSEKGGRSIDAPCGTLTTRDRHAVIDGGRMRFLTVDEQRDIMGFPPDYLLPKERRLATHMLGNAVCPPVMRAIAKALRDVA